MERMAPVSTNVSLTAIVDRSVVEVFVGMLPTGRPGPVVSSGVFVDAGSSEAVLELFCDQGGAATVDATAWILAPPAEHHTPLKSDDVPSRSSLLLRLAAAVAVLPRLAAQHGPFPACPTNLPRQSDYSVQVLQRSVGEGGGALISQANGTAPVLRH